MSGRRALPAWVVPTWVELRDLSCLALRLVVEQRIREAAGMVAVAGWLRGWLRGPAIARTDGAALRQVALCELGAAEGLLDDGHAAPPLHELCQLLEVAYWPPMQADAGYARGVWLSLRWALGEIRPPLNLPIRRLDGGVDG